MESKTNPVISCDLYYDDSLASEQALELIELSKLPYRSFRASGYNLPSISVGGTSYLTIEGVSGVIHSLAPHVFDSTPEL